MSSSITDHLAAALDELRSAASLTRSAHKAARAATPAASPYAGQRSAIVARQQADRAAQLLKQHALERQHQAQAAVAGRHHLSVEIHRQQAFGAPPDAVLRAVARRFGDDAARLAAVAMGLDR